MIQSTVNKTPIRYAEDAPDRRYFGSGPCLSWRDGTLKVRDMPEPPQDHGVAPVVVEHQHRANVAPGDRIAASEERSARYRTTHNIGKITAYGKGRGTGGGRPPAPKVSNGCDHSQHKRWKHDKYRFKCSGCETLINFSEVAA